jgi:hypothetical protein
MIQKRLPAILQNLEESSGTMKRTVYVVNEQVEAAAITMKKVQAIVSVLMEFESVVRLGLRLPIFRLLRNTGAVARGVKVFWDVYTSGPRRLTK